MASELEYVLFTKKEVFVYKIPARSPQGHRAEEWKECIWRGQLQVVSGGEDCVVKLLDQSSGRLFAKCPVTQNYEQAVERTVDSSRYFVLRVEGGPGRHAFIGVGFESRSDAFDFNCTLSDYARRRLVELQETSKDPLAQKPQRDYSLKKGQKIKVELKGLKTKTRHPADAATSDIPTGLNIPAPSSSSVLSGAPVPVTTGLPSKPFPATCRPSNFADPVPAASSISITSVSPKRSLGVNGQSALSSVTAGATPFGLVPPPPVTKPRGGAERHEKSVASASPLSPTFSNDLIPVSPLNNTDVQALPITIDRSSFDSSRVQGETTKTDKRDDFDLLDLEFTDFQACTSLPAGTSYTLPSSSSVVPGSSTFSSLEVASNSTPYHDSLHGSLAPTALASMTSFSLSEPLPYATSASIPTLSAASDSSCPVTSSTLMDAKSDIRLIPSTVVGGSEHLPESPRFRASGLGPNKGAPYCDSPAAIVDSSTCTTASLTTEDKQIAAVADADSSSDLLTTHSSGLLWSQPSAWPCVPDSGNVSSVNPVTTSDYSVTASHSVDVEDDASADAATLDWRHTPPAPVTEKTQKLQPDNSEGCSEPTDLWAPRQTSSITCDPPEQQEIVTCPGSQEREASQPPSVAHMSDSQLVDECDRLVLTTRPTERPLANVTNVQINFSAPDYATSPGNNTAASASEAANNSTAPLPPPPFPAEVPFPTSTPCPLYPFPQDSDMPAGSL